MNDINNIQKTILITGATDGIGLETAKMFAEKGHNLFIHGRSSKKINDTKSLLLDIAQSSNIETFTADFSFTTEVTDMSKSILEKTKKLDVIINNAGISVINNSEVMTTENLDIRFSINTIAPYILTNNLLPILNFDSRVINLASAAQAPIDFEALMGNKILTADEAYAQSKLALIIWSIEMAENKNIAPKIISVNPKSFLGSKMVKTAYGHQGFDLKIGANILSEASMSEKFSDANGKYFDNDSETFISIRPYAFNKEHRQKLIDFIDMFL